MRLFHAHHLQLAVSLSVWFLEICQLLELDDREPDDDDQEDGTEATPEKETAASTLPEQVQDVLKVWRHSVHGMRVLGRTDPI